MAAGLGFKTFNTGDVLSAADVNGYLMQGVLVFADATARDAAITSPQEGQFAYTKDNNSLWYYSGSAWIASGATGDIEGVTAGVGISGGGTSGTVTITNSMATAIDAKGDLVVGTGADTFSKLTVGANGTVLTADSAEATGLKWVTAGGGGKVLQVVSATTSTSSTTTSSTFADNNLTASITPSATSSKVLILVTQNYTFIRSGNEAGGGLRLMRDSTAIFNTTANNLQLYKHIPGSTAIEFYENTAITYLDSPNTTSSTTYKMQHAVAYSSSSGSFSSQAQTASTITLLEIGA
jgi:hypothetical protein